MVVLDTDHLSEIDRGSESGARLQARLLAENQEPAATIVSAEEQFRGWLAQIHQEPDPHRQIQTYARLQRRIDFLRGMDCPAVGRYCRRYFCPLESGRRARGHHGSENREHSTRSRVSCPVWQFAGLSTSAWASGRGLVARMSGPG